MLWSFYLFLHRTIQEDLITETIDYIIITLVTYYYFGMLLLPFVTLGKLPYAVLFPDLSTVSLGARLSHF